MAAQRRQGTSKRRIASSFAAFLTARRPITGTSCPATFKNEAHHILCVAQVNKCVVGKTIEVQKVLDESKWCINSTKNMVALPLWGTTVMYYCKDFSQCNVRDEVGAVEGSSGGTAEQQKDTASI